jgi:hypothetical protein
LRIQLSNHCFFAINFHVSITTVFLAPHCVYQGHAGADEEVPRLENLLSAFFDNFTHGFSVLILNYILRSGQRPQMMDDDEEGLQAMLRRGINAQADDDQAAQVPVNLNEIPLGMSLNTFAQQENVRREIK